MANKDKSYYMALPYSIVIKRMDDESGQYYYSTVLELDGCQSHGDTAEEAYNNIREAMEGWIETKLAHGGQVPEPKDTEEYSGKSVVRMPKSLHRKLAIQAALEGVSLNTYMLYKLSQ
ncbi:toxin-antitoxin system HicB family antitoxin [Virgibacillus dakarensis]|nr:toxin-antitoxin system HicB family antitoxin [Virgibacillus dakarensis]